MKFTKDLDFIPDNREAQKKFKPVNDVSRSRSSGGVEQ